MLDWGLEAMLAGFQCRFDSLSKAGEGLSRPVEGCTLSMMVDTQLPSL
jgi:hypothetical protein